MKKSEWERRRPLDLEGVQLLGAALYLRAKWLRDMAQAKLRSREEAELAGPINEFEWPFELEFYQDQHASEELKCKELEIKLLAIDTPKSAYSRAKSLRAKDFRFRWDHLKMCAVLVGYISDDQPRFAEGWDRETAISERWGDGLTAALEDIFEKEYGRLCQEMKIPCLTYRTVKTYCSICLFGGFANQKREKANPKAGDGKMDWNKPLPTPIRCSLTG